MAEARQFLYDSRSVVVETTELLYSLIRLAGPLVILTWCFWRLWDVVNRRTVP